MEKVYIDHMIRSTYFGCMEFAMNANLGLYAIVGSMWSLWINLVITELPYSVYVSLFVFFRTSRILRFISLSLVVWIIYSDSTGAYDIKPFHGDIMPCSRNLYGDISPLSAMYPMTHVSGRAVSRLMSPDVSPKPR